MQMFQPQLTLHREPDGEFTLDAVTPTPSSCSPVPAKATRPRSEPSSSCTRIASRRRSNA